MEYQKFIPEGWYNTKEEFSISKIENAMQTGEVMQGIAYKCDENYNVHVKLSEKIDGIIPRSEIDALGIDDKGQIKIGVCKNKVNNFVQFKVKEIYNDSKVILSRKDVCLDAFNWVSNELSPGMIVNRNC